ncbi:hypothetical protein RAD15_37620 [Bradyrhizobium sp. 14AA]
MPPVFYGANAERLCPAMPAIQIALMFKDIGRIAAKLRMAR